MLNNEKKALNILWICTDQQRFDTLGCYNNKFVDTPNINRLAERGVLFENCYTQSPVCTPSRASFLTGRYPRTTRCRQNGQAIPEDEKLVTKMLAENGYICGLSGKLHIAPCNPHVCSGMEGRIDDGYAEFHWSHHHAPDWPTNEYIEWLIENGVQYKVENINQSSQLKYGMSEEYHQTTWCANKAITFIKSMENRKNPWLFSVNIFDPHPPFDPPKEYLEKYMKVLDEVPMPNYVEGELENKPIFQNMDHAGTYHNPKSFVYDNMSEKDHKLVKAAYWAMCDLIDKQVGRMVEALESTGQLDNTVVIFTSDHGEMLGDHGIYLKGPYFYECAVHVPLIISMPGVIKEGYRSKALVELMDLAPTILDAAGVEAYPGMQAKSLWDLLTRREAEDYHKDVVYSEYYNAMPWHKSPKNPQATMIFDGRYKMVKYHGANQGELYDLNTDPTETNNLWNDCSYKEVKLEMLDKLCDSMAWTVDPLPGRVSVW